MSQQSLTAALAATCALAALRSSVATRRIPVVPGPLEAPADPDAD